MSKKFKSIEPILHEVLDIWGNRKSGSLTGVPSGFYDLDNLLSGFQNSDFIILAGGNDLFGRDKVFTSSVFSYLG